MIINILFRIVWFIFWQYNSCNDSCALKQIPAQRRHIRPEMRNGTRMSGRQWGKKCKTFRHKTRANERKTNEFERVILRFLNFIVLNVVEIVHYSHQIHVHVLCINVYSKKAKIPFYSLAECLMEICGYTDRVHTRLTVDEWYSSSSGSIIAINAIVYTDYTTFKLQAHKHFCLVSPGKRQRI